MQAMLMIPERDGRTPLRRRRKHFRQRQPPLPPALPCPDTKAAEKKLLSTFFLLPRGEGSTFSITYTAPGKLSTGATITQTISLAGQPLPSLDQWTQGAFITYTIGIEKKQITVTAATQPTWTDSGKETVTGSYTITYATGPADSGWSNGGNGYR